MKTFIQLITAYFLRISSRKNTFEKAENGVCFSVFENSTFKIAVLTVVLITSRPVGNATNYRTINNGNWSTAGTWQGGSIPPATINSSDSVIIRHSVTYSSSNNLEFNGVVLIQPIGFSTARLNVASGKNIEINSSGRLLINNASFRQYRFGSGNDGQPYSGNSPGASLQSGNFVNKGGYIRAINSYIEVAQNWSSESGGVRYMNNSCIYTGQNYNLSGSSSRDTLIGVYVSIGWHGSGNFEVSDARISFNSTKIQLAGTGGHFKLNSGTANGDIDYIFLRNQIVPFTGSGNIEVSSSVNNSPSLVLDAYCAASSSNLIHNGKFSGSRSLNCGLNHFPGSCVDGGLTMLSVELIDLKVRTIEQTKAEISWKTSSEKDNSKFVVEKSTDGLNWYMLDELRGAGNSDVLKSYKVIDQYPAVGLSYYRIKSIDHSGDSENSNICAYNSLQQLNVSSISVYPNPANQFVNLEIGQANEITEDISLILLDSKGLEIQVKFELIGNVYQIQTNDLPEGLYFVKLQGIHNLNKLSFYVGH